MNYAPILVFVYNRPQLTMQLIESLLKNKLAKKSTLIIYSDGSKNENTQLAVNKTRNYIHSITGFQTITIIERAENWGLARNIIDGVTTQVNIFGKVIVLEDDLVLSPFFLQFMNDALDVYKDEPKVGHIHACDFTQNATLPETYLINWMGCWGWGTWDSAWKLFNPNGIELLKQLEDRKLTSKFDFNGASKYTRMLRHQIEGKNNSWAIRWNASLFLNDVLSLCVGNSLVQNVGFDGSGTHCKVDGLHASKLTAEPISVCKITPIEENTQARRCLEEYYRKSNSFYSKVKRRIQRLF